VLLVLILKWIDQPSNLKLKISNVFYDFFFGIIIFKSNMNKYDDMAQFKNGLI